MTYEIVVQFLLDSYLLVFIFPFCVLLSKQVIVYICGLVIWRLRRDDQLRAEIASQAQSNARVSSGIIV